MLRRDGDHHRVTGRKYYSTGTAFADFARINVENEQGDALAVIIPVARGGVRVLDDWDGMGQRMTASGSLLLHDVQVFADEVAARDGSTLVGRHCGALRQLHLVATAAGIVRNVVADARRYVLTHGRPVLHSSAPSARDDHFIQQIVGELSAHSHAIDALVRDNAAALDRSADAIEAGARMRTNACSTARSRPHARS
ncbi:acyl-CoA dehydrogenase-like protein [Burkholderia ambifaria MEX-5]|uniref:Acyl-CoA dehydrogenase-like protein n=1 Tax=Burkholderia ambifaria MEX-5 TaxID=396597 RepID=B1TEL5_9BURK|nr:acyl-CoA dehydrogenase-like protein [Burkholderia ambifaria MEX-5]